MLKNAVSLIFSFGLFFALVLPSQAQSSLPGTNLSVTPSEFSDPLGSFVQGEIKVENTSDEKITLKIGVTNSEDQKIGSNVTGFFGSLRIYGDLPEDFEDLLDDSQGEVALACKKRDDSNDLDNWCDGEKIFSLTLDPQQKSALPYTFRIPLTVEATSAFLQIQLDEEEQVSDEDDAKQGQDQDEEDSDSQGEVFSTQLLYEPPTPKVISSEIKELKLKRSFGKLNFWRWMRTGFREAYDGRVLIENTGNQTIPYTITLNVERPNGQNEQIERSGEVSQGEQKAESFESIGMPRLGTALIDARLSYEGNDGLQESQTDQARVANTPIKEIVGFIILLASLVTGYILFQNTRSRKETVQPQKKDLFQRKNQGSLAKSHELTDGKSLYENPDRFATRSDGDQYTQSRAVSGIAPKKVVTKSTTRRMPRKSIEVPQEQEDQRYTSLNPQVASQRGPSPLVTSRQKSDDPKTSKDMNIDWIGEDDTVFDSAMRLQEKKMNMKVGASVLGLFALGVLTLLFLGNKYFAANQGDDVSIVDLNTQEDQNMPNAQDANQDDTAKDPGLSESEDQEKTDQEVTQPKDEISDEPQLEKDKEKEKEKDKEKEKEKKETISDTSSLVVQVLNGGSTAGAAGDLTKALSADGYEVLAATNARNDYVGNVVYHAEKSEGEADQIIKDIGDKYGPIDIENAQFVLDIYNADLVVVLGG